MAVACIIALNNIGNINKPIKTENWNEKYQITRQPLSFGNYVTGNLYWSSAIQLKNNQPCPVVVWLHPYSYSMVCDSSDHMWEFITVDMKNAGVKPDVYTFNVYLTSLMVEGQYEKAKATIDNFICSHLR